jgi:osmotically-inducible protein OsmY
MKTVTILVVFTILIAGSAYAFQDTMAPAAKKQPAKPKQAVDCSKVNDATLAASVKDKLSNTPSLKAYTITATAKDGKVTLTGFVKKATNKGLATSQTRRIPCVKGVDNQITVEAKPADEKKKA